MKVEKVEYYELKLVEEEAKALWKLIKNTSRAMRSVAISPREDELVRDVYYALSNYFDNDEPPF